MANTHTNKNQLINDYTMDKSPGQRFSSQSDLCSCSSGEPGLKRAQRAFMKLN